MRIRPALDTDLPVLQQWATSGQLSAVSWVRLNYSLPLHIGIIEMNGAPAGGVTLFDIDVQNRSAEVSCYLVDPRTRGLGIGVRALRQMMKKGFDRYPIDRIQAQTLASNKEVNDMLKRGGFVREGTRRAAAVIDGTPHHVAVWSMLRREFDARWRR